jgi:putative DNA primase/helicase
VVEKRFIAPTSATVKDAVALIEALGCDPRSGMCVCPGHDDHSPSLSVREVDGKLLVHCFVCEQDHLLARLRELGLWPITHNAPSGPALTPRRSDAERREYALKILEHTRANRGVDLAEFLIDYFAGRGITAVPSTAMLAVPHNTDPHLGERLVPDDPGMVFEVTDGQKIIGAHVTWLSPDLTAKRKQEPQRQFFGPVGGGFIKLYAGELDPKGKLIVAEGIETAMAASQIAGGLPAIAALSAKNLVKITPPPAAEYIIAADNDAPGLAGARALAAKLVRAGQVVRLAVPTEPQSDWNDMLIKKGEGRGCAI